jgi:RNA polymerase sigma-70 factor (ECF subfamily)
MTFTQIAQKYSPLLHNYFRKKFSRQDANDLMQDTFLKVYTGSNRFERGKDFYPWVMTIARNVGVDYLRKRGRCKENIGSFDFEQEKSLGDSVDKLVENNEKVQMLYDAIDQLTQGQQKIIKLHLLGYSIKEMMKELEINESAAKVKVYRAKKKLKTILNL